MAKITESSLNFENGGFFPEPYISIKDASRRLGIQYFKLARFVRSGAVRSYCVGNSRRLVRMTELVEAIARSSTGAEND